MLDGKLVESSIMYRLVNVYEKQRSIQKLTLQHIVINLEGLLYRQIELPSV